MNTMCYVDSLTLPIYKPTESTKPTSTIPPREWGRLGDRYHSLQGGGIFKTIVNQLHTFFFLLKRNIFVQLFVNFVE